MSRIFPVAAGLFSLALLATASQAATIFTANGAASNGAVLSGTVTIDTTLGLITGINVAVSAPGSIVGNTIAYQGPGGSGFYVVVTPSFADPSLGLSFPVTTLVGYTGGDLCTFLAVCGGQATGYTNSSGGATFFTTASLTAVPEPTSGLLIGGGLFALVAFRRRRASAPR